MISILHTRYPAFDAETPMQHRTILAWQNYARSSSPTPGYISNVDLLADPIRGKQVDQSGKARELIAKGKLR